MSQQRELAILTMDLHKLQVDQGAMAACSQQEVATIK